MLDRLVASQPYFNPLHVLTGGGYSVALHALALASAVYVTSRAGPSGMGVTTDTTMVFITPATRQPDKPEPPKQMPITSLSQLKGFQTIVAPTDIPANIPAIDFTERFDPRDYSGIGVEGGMATGIDLPGIGPDAGQVYAINLVTEQPDRLAGPVPVYPAMLKQAGIEGRVMLQAVVDSAGRVEPASIRVLASPNPGFDAVSVAALRETVFRPARVNGRAVRVLIKIPFDFVIRR